MPLHTKLHTKHQNAQLFGVNRLIPNKKLCKKIFSKPCAIIRTIHFKIAFNQSCYVFARVGVLLQHARAGQRSPLPLSALTFSPVLEFFSNTLAPGNALRSRSPHSPFRPCWSSSPTRSRRATLSALTFSPVLEFFSNTLAPGNALTLFLCTVSQFSSFPHIGVLHNW